MKTLISSTGAEADSPYDLRFGRAAWFCLFDEESGETTFYENEHKNANQGAGLKVVEFAAGLGAGKVISGDFGPKAKELLDKFKIQMVILPGGEMLIKEIIDKLRN